MIGAYDPTLLGSYMIGWFVGGLLDPLMWVMAMLIFLSLRRRPLLAFVGGAAAAALLFLLIESHYRERLSLPSPSAVEYLPPIAALWSLLCIFYLARYIIKNFSGAKKPAEAQEALADAPAEENAADRADEAAEP